MRKPHSCVVLVCGGRDYDNLTELTKYLDTLHEDVHITKVIHSGARGADMKAGMWAMHRGIPVEVFQALWNVHRRAAGPIRNQQMIDQKPDFVVAFKGGAGTTNMVSLAEQRGVIVKKVNWGGQTFKFYDKTPSPRVEVPATIIHPSDHSHLR